jgi:glycosyltransferase involved in cell wall biosynthesis
MRVLVVLAQPPLPEGGAPARCAVALLRGLTGHGLDVTALAARQLGAAPGDPPPDLPVDVVRVPPDPPGWGGRLQRLQRPRGWLSRGAFGERVRQLARQADVLHLEETDTAWCNLGTTTPALLHVHYLIREDQSWPSPWDREARHFVEFILAERAATRRHRHLVASSPRVAEELERRAGRSRVPVAPLSLDPDSYARASLDGPPTAGIIGTASWLPTQAAVLRLVDRVWPLVRRAVPDAQLLVAGRGTSELLRSRDVPGVSVVGEVPSAPAFLQGLSVLLYPLERGSGMKVKVLESIACGLPVVTTPLGAEGIVVDGVTIRTDDRSLAAAAAELLSDPGARRQQGASARAAFLAGYTPAVATEPLVGLYRQIAGG